MAVDRAGAGAIALSAAAVIAGVGASPWVGKEVEYWLANKSTDTLLIGVTSGTLDWDGKKGDFRWKPAPPLPAVFKGKFPAEPKWVDLTAYRDGADPKDNRFLDLGADFAAAIHGMPKEDLLSQEVRQQKRALRLAVSAAGVMLLLAVGAVTAGIIAKVQAERAERNFAAAKDTVDSLIFNIAQGLRNVEGMRIESVDKILGQVRKTVDRLAESDPDNVSLMRSKDVMLDEFAKTYMTAGNLGEARKNAEESLSLLRRIIDSRRAQPGTRAGFVGRSASSWRHQARAGRQGRRAGRLWRKPRYQPPHRQGQREQRTSPIRHHAEPRSHRRHQAQIRRQRRRAGRL